MTDMDSTIFWDIELHTIKNKQTCIQEEHRHSHHELYFLLDGNARHFINNEIQEISAGQAVFVWQDYIHKVSYDPEKSAQRLLVSFSTAFIGSEYLPVLRQMGKRKFFPLPPDSSAVIKQLLLTLYDEKKKTPEHHLLQCQNLLRQILILLSRQTELCPPQNISQNEAIIQQAARHISKNYAQPLSLHDLAQMFAMSDCHFSRTFKLYTGVGVAQYIRHTRLRAAEKLLRQGDCSVTDVALACGFNNSNYFICEFKKHRGITPLQYSLLSKTGD